MTVMSKVQIAASTQLLLPVKKFLFHMFRVATVAAAGSTIADATPVLYGRNVVTGADDAKGVLLPKAEPDATVEIVNTVSNKTLLVYPNSSSEQINAITAGSAFSLVGGARGQFYCDSAGHWYVAAANLTGTSTSATTAQLDAATLAASNSRTSTTTDTISAADFGMTIYLNSATGYVTTLPAPIAGFKCTVISKTANTSGDHTIVTNSSANIIKGLQNSVAGDAGDSGTADDTISFVANQSVAGDKVELHSDGTSWFAHAISKVAAGITFTQAS